MMERDGRFVIGRSMHVVENAPAKLNLALHVVGRRPDGYHLLESLVAFTELGDTISVAPHEFDMLDVAGPYGSLIEGPNLIETARDRLRERVGGGSVRIELLKNLPVASGLGGGSADAAATLRALRAIWDPDANTVSEVAASLGADVPMCLASATAIARGVGDVLAPTGLAVLGKLSVLLVNPGVPVSTPAVFEALASRENAPVPPLPENPETDTLLDWLATTRNDLEAPARLIAPEIGDALASLHDSAFARMSGSGATCFGLYRSERDAEAARTRIASERPDWFVARTRFLLENDT